MTELTKMSVAELGAVPDSELPWSFRELAQRLAVADYDYAQMTINRDYWKARAEAAEAVARKAHLHIENWDEAAKEARPVTDPNQYPYPSKIDPAELNRHQAVEITRLREQLAEAESAHATMTRECQTLIAERDTLREQLRYSREQEAHGDALLERVTGLMQSAVVERGRMAMRLAVAREGLGRIAEGEHTDEAPDFARDTIARMDQEARNELD